VAGSVLTLTATPWLFSLAPWLAARLAGAAERLMPVPEVQSPAEGHAVLVGFGLAGRTLARVLAASGVPCLALDANPASVTQARARGEAVVFGDATRTPILERLGVSRARLVAIALSDPVATRRCVALVRDLAPATSIVVRTRYVAEVDRLSAAGADVVVVEEFEATIDMVRAALRAFDFPGDSIERFSEQMREEGYELMRAPPALALDPWLTETLSEVGTEWIEVPEGPAVGGGLESLDVRRRTGASILAVERAGRTTANPDPDFPLVAGDRLLAYGRAENLRRLRRLLAGESEGGRV
jgi:CPA2 family monovalent cation:H+ antiporter-2